MSQKLSKLEDSVNTLTTMVDDLYEAAQVPDTTLASIEDAVATIKTSVSDLDDLVQEVKVEFSDLGDKLDDAESKTEAAEEELENQKNLVVEVNTGMDMARVYLDNGNLLDRQVFEMIAEAYAGGKTSTNILCHLRLLK